jgi:hypothetical protein
MSKIEVNQISSQCGSTLTVGQSGDTVTLAAGATQTGFGRTGTVDWNTTAITADPANAVSGTGYFANTTSAAFTITLPTSPSAGDIVAVRDYAQTFATNNLTIGRNSQPIDGLSNDLTLSTSGQAITLVYVDGTQGWKSVNSNETINEIKYITATGGTVTCCGDYKIHTFTGPGTFTVTCSGNAAGSNSVDYLAVAGGGGGSWYAGGGAGGYRESSGTASGSYTVSPLGACVSALPITATGYPITVGGGGPGARAGTQGSNSVFSTITSTGGGGGRDGDGTPAGGPGGSGGGGDYRSAPYGNGGTGNTPPVSPPQGNPGGDGSGITGTTIYAGGGGGGAGAVGNNATNPSAGPGGNGVTSSINGTPTARGGGGGGATYPPNPGTVHPGGTGGGGTGTGASGGAATSGTANTGGGGGGGGETNPNSPGSGGSGIVIIRYKFQ